MSSLLAISVITVCCKSLIDFCMDCIEASIPSTTWYLGAAMLVLLRTATSGIVMCAGGVVLAADRASALRSSPARFSACASLDTETVGLYGSVYRVWSVPRSIPHWPGPCRTANISFVYKQETFKVLVHPREVSTDTLFINKARVSHVFVALVKVYRSYLLAYRLY